jgi:hypothetical protein
VLGGRRISRGGARRPAMNRARDTSMPRCSWHRRNRVGTHRRRGTEPARAGRAIAVLLGCGLTSWLLAAVPGSAVEETLATVRIRSLPEQPRQGDVAVVSVEAAPELEVRRGQIRSEPLLFSPLPDSPGKWEALYGVDAEMEPGEVEVTIWTRSPGQGEGMKKGSLRILARHFPEERLTLPDSMVHLSPENLHRVRREETVISALWPVATPTRYWIGPFGAPLEGRPGSPFGLRRWINGEPRNFHTGMDVKADEGTPVRAANAGRVALTGEYFFGGKSVFLDHGQGLYSMYFHLSRIEVKPGQRVRAGEILGRVGQTGRASGPHLHWGVRLGGARVDPEALIESTRNPAAAAGAR